MMNDTLDVQETAITLGVKPATIRAWVLRRKLPYFKSGRLVRFKREWIEDFINRNTIPARVSAEGARQ